MALHIHDKIERDLSGGTAWLLVLAIVARSQEGGIHGYEICRQLADEAPAGLAFKQGTLYPILRTMEVEGLIVSVLVPSTEGPARRCFHLTPEGRQTLDAWTAFWNKTRRWVDSVLLDIHNSPQRKSP